MTGGNSRRAAAPTFSLSASWRRGNARTILETIQARCGLDGFHTQGPQGLLLPAHSDIIVVLDDACRLSEDEQRRFFWWVRQHHAQVTSFASTSLYDLVRAGRFMEALYYHLNTICVVLTPSASLANRRPADR